MLLIYLRQKRTDNSLPAYGKKWKHTVSELKVGLPVPRAGISREALMTDVLDYQGQRVQLGYQVRETGFKDTGLFRNQLSFVEFKKSLRISGRGSAKFGKSPGPSPQH